MKIVVNGKEEIIESEMTITDFLKNKKQDPKKVVIVYNGEVKDKAEWDQIILDDNDDLEVLKFVGGG